MSARRRLDERAVLLTPNAAAGGSGEQSPKRKTIGDTPSPEAERRKGKRDFLTPQLRGAQSALRKRRASASPHVLARRRSEAAPARIAVAVRIRPLPSPPPKAAEELLAVEDSQRVLLRSRDGAQKEYGFGHVLDHRGVTGPEALDASQAELFDRLGSDLVRATLSGLNVSLLAYGQTGSGKTFSVTGTPEAPGFVPRFCKALFDGLGEGSNVTLGYYQIYNEKIYDLLGDPKAELRLRSDPVAGQHVEGLSSRQIGSLADFERWAEVGQRRRATAATAFNQHSSRSHAVLELRLRQPREATVNGAAHAYALNSRVCLVDLAGSERTSRLHAHDGSAPSKSLFDESVNINLSLHNLNRVVHTLSSGKRDYVSYRDSVLTHLLKDSLGGNAHSVVLVTVSAAADDAQHTQSSLHFGSQAANVVLKPRINRDDRAELLAQIQSLNEELESYREAEGADPQAQRAQQSLMEKELRAEIERSQAELHQAEARAEREQRRREKEAAESQATLRRLSLELREKKEGPLARHLKSSTPGLILLSEDPELSIFFPLMEPATTLGSANEAEIQLRSPDVAPKALRFQETHTGWVVESLRASTEEDDAPAAFVNGKPLKGKRRLNHGDRLALGKSALLILSLGKGAEAVGRELSYASVALEWRQGLEPVLAEQQRREAEKEKEAVRLELQERLAELQSQGKQKERSVCQKFRGHLLSRMRQMAEEQERSRLAEKGRDEETEQLDSLRTEIQHANQCLGKLGRAHLQLSLERSEDDSATALFVIVLENSRSRLWAELTMDDFQRRYANLRRAVVSMKCGDQERKWAPLVEGAVERASDPWRATCPRSPNPSSLYLRAIDNSVRATAVEMGVREETVRASLTPSSVRASSRRSTFARLLDTVVGDASPNTKLSTKTGSEQATSGVERCTDPTLTLLRNLRRDEEPEGADVTPGERVLTICAEMLGVGGLEDLRTLARQSQLCSGSPVLPSALLRLSLAQTRLQATVLAFHPDRRFQSRSLDSWMIPDHLYALATESAEEVGREAAGLGQLLGVLMEGLERGSSELAEETAGLVERLGSVVERVGEAVGAYAVAANETLPTALLERLAQGRYSARLVGAVWRGCAGSVERGLLGLGAANTEPAEAAEALALVLRALRSAKEEAEGLGPVEAAAAYRPLVVCLAGPLLKVAGNLCDERSWPARRTQASDTLQLVAEQTSYPSLRAPLASISFAHQQ